MFVAGQVQVEASFALAQARLARLALTGGLLAASRGAYGAGLTGLVTADPPGHEPQMAGLATAHFGDLIGHLDSARVALRWEAIGPGGELFPALDADLTLSPAGDQATTLTLTGVYRPPPGIQDNGLGRAVVRRAAQTTVQAFLNRIATAITIPARAPEWNGGTGQKGGFPPPAAQAP
jgi:hypothetical protein